jgi:DNA-binding NarL/FixJ family response regulator
MIRVLLVDDHQLVRAGLASLIDAEPDMTVIATAADGAEGVRHALRENPDVVLMDMSMPGMSGETATAKIIAALPGTAVVVLTAFSDQERIREALRAGAVGYLLKDADPGDLLRGVRTAARGESPLDGKVARMLLDSPAFRSPPPVDLTDREHEVLTLLARGLSNKQIGRTLGIAERTVKSHLTSAYQRLGVTDRTQAALTYSGMRYEDPAGSP